MSPGEGALVTRGPDSPEEPLKEDTISEVPGWPHFTANGRFLRRDSPHWRRAAEYSGGAFHDSVRSWDWWGQCILAGWWWSNGRKCFSRYQCRGRVTVTVNYIIIIIVCIELYVICVARNIVEQRESSQFSLVWDKTQKLVQKPNEEQNAAVGECARCSKQGFQHWHSDTVTQCLEASKLGNFWDQRSANKKYSWHAVS